MDEESMRYPAKVPAFAILLLLGLTACGASAPAQVGDLARYQLDAAPDWTAPLPDELHEISGLAVGPGGRVFAHGDEAGRIYEIEPRSGKIVKSFALQPGDSAMDLGKKKSKNGEVTGDFEDLAIVDDRFYLVTSNGVILEFGEGENGAQVPFTAHQTGVGETCEIEGLVSDAEAQTLLLVCKEMKSKGQRDRIEAFAWSTDKRQVESGPRLTIPFNSLGLAGSKQFNASAVTFIPGTRSLALVAGPQATFLEVGADGKPVAGGALDQTVLTQPEGMAFLPDETLLISTEGGKGQAMLAGYQAEPAGSQ
jgi:hypothetical protein